LSYRAANSETVAGEVRALVEALDHLYGLYLDATAGFKANHDLIVRGQRETAEGLPPGTDPDSLGFLVGRGAPTDPATVLLHRTTQGEFKRRNAPGGSNHVRLAQLTLVLVFAYWETAHRARIAHALGLKGQNELTVPIMGDLRRLRHDILHNRGVIQTKTVGKLEVLKAIKAEAPLTITDLEMENLFRNIKTALDDLAVQAGGDDPKHRTVWRAS